MATVYKQTAVKSKSDWLHWVLLWLISLCQVFGSGEEKCQQKGPCVCIFPNNSVINLTPLCSSVTNKPAFSGVSDGKDGLISYNPCHDFTDSPAEECKNVAICRENLIESSYTSLGNNDNASFGTDLQSFQTYLFYQDYVEGNPVHTYVYLICTPQGSQPNLRAKYINSSLYHLHLYSHSACALPVTREHGLSTGSIICIVYFSLLLGYFGIGILYRRSVHQARGLDQLPHASFWMELPGLIKDGYLFFISPCLGNNIRYQAYHYEQLS